MLAIVHLTDQEGRAPRLGCEHRVRSAVEEGNVEAQEVLELLTSGGDHHQGHQVCDGGHHVSHVVCADTECLAVTEASVCSLHPASTRL